MDSARILVVDDEEDLRDLVSRVLERAGFTVGTAVDGQAGVEQYFADAPDLVILDVSMPRLDGWGALDRIREASEVPVIMLTARDSELDRVRGLRSGADDYLPKPFGRQELVARVEALLRRSRRGQPAADARYEDGFLTLDRVQRIVVVGGTEVSLTPLEFRLLSVLVAHAGEVLTRERLRELVWNDAQSLAPEQVKLYVSYLRRKLDAAAGGAAPPIETVRGAGYRYVPPPA
jgi:DNA-binding response OmpR family regulator